MRIRQLPDFMLLPLQTQENSTRNREQMQNTGFTIYNNTYECNVDIKRSTAKTMNTKIQSGTGAIPLK